MAKAIRLLAGATGDVASWMSRAIGRLMTDGLGRLSTALSAAVTLAWRRIMWPSVCRLIINRPCRGLQLNIRDAVLPVISFRMSRALATGLAMSLPLSLSAIVLVPMTVLPL